MMYLLLRDNKQSGPYSLDEIKAKGLKAYDLVWVEGKSAAWRYPSEVNELSAFAPAVEEQPFDRFYKRPVAAAAVVAGSAGASGYVAPPQSVVPEVSSATGASTTRSRTIYVTMPGGSAPVVLNRDTQPREMPAEPARTIVREPAPVREVAPVREMFVEQAPATPYYAVRSQGTSEQSGEIVPPLPKSKPGRLLLLAGIGIGVVVLLAAGVFIGLSIQKEAPGSQQHLKSEVADNTASSVHPTAQQLPVSPVVNQAANSTPAPPVTAPTAGEAQSGSSSNPATGQTVVTRPLRAATPKQKVEAGQAAGSNHAVPVAATDSPAAQSPDLHREAVHRDAVNRTGPGENQPVVDKEAMKATALKSLLANQVSVGGNKYEVGTFGGINNLQVTVSNRSAYSLDLVTVEVQYIQANKKVYKTENLYFHGIGPGSALMLEAPKSSRGVQVQYKITSINSKELGLSVSGI